MRPGENVLAWCLVECLRELYRAYGNSCVCACLLIVFVYSRMSTGICFHNNIPPGGEFVGDRPRVPALLWSPGLLMFTKSS